MEPIEVQVAGGLDIFRGRIFHPWGTSYVGYATRLSETSNSAEAARLPQPLRTWTALADGIDPHALMFFAIQLILVNLSRCRVQYCGTDYP